MADEHQDWNNIREKITLYRERTLNWLESMNGMPFSPAMRIQIRKLVICDDAIGGERLRIHDLQSFFGKSVFTRSLTGKVGQKRGIEEGIMFDQPVKISPRSIRTSGWVSLNTMSPEGAGKRGTKRLRDDGQRDDYDTSTVLSSVEVKEQHKKWTKKEFRSVGEKGCNSLVKLCSSMYADYDAVRKVDCARRLLLWKLIAVRKLNKLKCAHSRLT